MCRWQSRGKPNAVLCMKVYLASNGKRNLNDLGSSVAQEGSASLRRRRSSALKVAERLNPTAYHATSKISSS